MHSGQTLLEYSVYPNFIVFAANVKVLAHGFTIDGLLDDQPDYCLVIPEQYNLLGVYGN